MARKSASADPVLSIDFWNSGFFSYRNPLFAPFRSVGINIVSFHDSIISGSNFEDTDKLEWTRRPGFSIFCSVPLSDTEIVNQFYSSRILNGTVFPWVDTTERLAIFSPTSILTVVEKNTEDQGYVSTIGNTTYFSDGDPVDLYKYDGAKTSVWGLAPPTITPVSSGLGFWQPYKRYGVDSTILDPNGCVEVVSSILIPNGAFESPSSASTVALAGSLSQTWEFDPVDGGYFVAEGYSLIQSGNSGSMTATATFTFPNPVTAGNSIILIFGEGETNYNPTVVSVTDNLGNTYTQQATGMGTYTGGGGNTYTSTAWVWTAPITNAGPCTVTVVTSGVGSSGLQLLAHEFFGINPTASVAASNFAVSTFFLNSGTVAYSGTALSLSSLLLFSTGAANIPNDYTDGKAAAGNWQLYDAYDGTTSPQSPLWEIPTGNGQALGISVVFPISTLATGYSPYLFLGNFNFKIPSGVTILGIQVNIPKWNTAAGTVADYSVRLVVGGIVVGTDMASSAAWSPSGYASAVYGGSAILWGLTPTPAEINANGGSGFGVVISANITDTTGGAVVPEVGFSAPNAPTITIFYKSADGLGGPGISGENEPIWATNTGGVVNDGGLTWTNYGNIQTWYPVTGYPTPVVILDTNGNLQLSTYLDQTIPEWDVSTTYSTLGQVVYFGGQYWLNVFNGSNVGVVPAVGYASTGSSVTVPYWALTTTPLVTGIIPPVWNTTIGGTTVDGSYTWTNIGQGTGLAFFGYEYVFGYRTIYGHLTTCSPYSNNTGAILGPLNATITSFSITSNIVTFIGDNNFIPGNVFTVSGLTVGTYLNDESFTVISAVPSETFPLTSVAVSGSNVLTILAINNLVAGQTVTFSALDTATFLNGATVTVLSSGLSGTQFEADFTHASYGPTSDSGSVTVIGSYTAAFNHADVGSTLDAGAANPLISTIVGAGTASPLCNSTASISSVGIVANIVTITASNNFQPGLWVTLTGLTAATFLNNQQFQVIAVDQPVGTQNTYFQVEYVTPNYDTTADTGTATFNAIEIYRTSDGGGTYLFDGAVTNPGTGVFSFNDFVPDNDLNIELVAPLNHQNDPPPGAPGSSIQTTGTILTYWQGRLWQVNGNYVYFDAGPDCTNGIPEESWPPAYRFQFAGPVFGIEPTADGVGLLVYLADRVAVILGGPETISFYDSDALSNFGIANPNAIYRDGSIIGQFTTQAQYIELVEKNKNEVGEHIADYLTANFNPVTSYATMHRQGLDVGVFISNGVDRVVRYGSNIGAWSVPAFPAFGAGALRSIETSVGVTTLMLASPGGSKSTSTGLINPTSGITTGGGIAWANPSNITLGTVSTYATVTFNQAGSSQILRASQYAPLSIPASAIVQGVQVVIVGKQTASVYPLTLTITPTNPIVGTESQTFSFGTSNTTIIYGGPADLWGMPWGSPQIINSGVISFDISGFNANPLRDSEEIEVAKVQVSVFYQNPGNYLYARDLNSWGDGGVYGQNNGTPYALAEVVVGSITLSQPGSALLPLEHIVGYFDAVGTLNNGGPSQPNIWVLPNEISATAGVGFVQLPEVLQEPPIGQNQPSLSLLALRYPVKAANSFQMSQFIHHLQVRINFSPECAPNTIKALAFMSDPAT